MMIFSLTVKIRWFFSDILFSYFIQSRKKLCTLRPLACNIWLSGPHADEWQKTADSVVSLGI
jgi:hypothetical protein